MQQSGVCVPGNYCQIVVPLRGKVSATNPPPLFVMHGTFKPYVSFLCITHKVILLMKHHGLDFMKQRDPTNEELIIISGKKVVSKKNSNLHISF